MIKNNRKKKQQAKKIMRNKQNYCHRNINLLRYLSFYLFLLTSRLSKLEKKTDDLHISELKCKEINNIYIQYVFMCVFY